jgi:hypothetical protein
MSQKIKKIKIKSQDYCFKSNTLFYKGTNYFISQIKLGTLGSANYSMPYITRIVNLGNNLLRA